jgi:hypothetical protein
VACPVQGKPLHCWRWSRCDRARLCTAWRTHRNEVEFFRDCGEPYSFYLAESGMVGVLQ